MPERRFLICRYDPECDTPPRLQACDFDTGGGDRILLEASTRLEAIDPSLSFRRSCSENMCGSDAMNNNGKNGLACVTNLRALRSDVGLEPLPGLPVIRGSIVEMTGYVQQYHSIKPWLVNDDPPEHGRLQSPQAPDELDGLYECVLYACCSSACPSFGWDPDRCVGPAALLQAYRFVVDGSDQASAARLDGLHDPYCLFRCRTILNCTDVCPKGLNPARAIGLLCVMQH